MSYIKQGDCLQLMNEIPDGSVDMILCDLPYGVTHNEWDAVIPTEPLFTQYKRVIKDDGAILLFAQMPFAARLVSAEPKLFRYEWVWHKTMPTGHLNARRMPLRAHENILVFYKRPPEYHPQMRPGKPYTSRSEHRTSNYNAQVATVTENDGTRYPIDVVTYSNNNRRSLHPTQKPVELLEYMIRTYTSEGDTVLDNCMGSGSTCVAAINTGRQYIGFEMDEGYFDIARRRIAEAEHGSYKGESERHG